jgi:MSHA biogenesis protein MshE
VPHEPLPNEHLWLKVELGDQVESHAYRRGSGCSHCANTGYQGRQAVYEYLDMTNTLVESVNRGDPNEFVQLGREQMGGNTLRRDAVRLVLAGRTTIEEAMRISTQLDE